MSFHLIDDGYALCTTIQESEGLHPALTVNFRPALADERFEHFAAKDVTGKAQLDRVSRLIARYLESWDAVNRKGDAVPATAENIRRLHPALLSKLLDLVLGYAPAEEAADAKN